MGCSQSAASPQVNEGDFTAVAAGDPLPGRQRYHRHEHQQQPQATPVRAAMDDQTTTTALAPGATEVPIQRAHSGRKLLSMAARCPTTNTIPSRPPATHVVGDTPATMPNPVSAALPSVPASEAISPPPPPPRTSDDDNAVATPSSGDTAPPPPPPSLHDQQHRNPLILPPAASDDHLHHQQPQPHHTSSHHRHRPPSSRVGQPPRPHNVTLLADLTSSVLSPDQVVTPHQRRRRTNGGGSGSLRLGFDHRTPSGPTSPTVAGATDAAVWDDDTTRKRSMASLLSDDVRMSSGSEVHPSITQWLCDIERSNP